MTGVLTRRQKSNEDSEDDSEDSEDESEDSADDAEEVQKPAPVSNKRKPETESPFAAKKAKVEEEASQGSNLFVGNLPWSIDEAGLGDLFAEFGELSAVRLITERDTGRSKGYVHIMPLGRRHV